MTRVRLFDLPHQEARVLLATGAPVHVSFNPVEYHGPHLPLGCDRLIGAGVREAFIERMAARFSDWPVLVVDDVDLGVEPTSGPGSRRHKYPSVRHVVTEACRALVELGARRVVLHTFHGSALHNLALEDGCEIVRRAGGQALAPFHLVINQMVDLDPERYAPAFDHVENEGERREMIENMALDFHGGFFETSMALHFAPASVSDSFDQVAPCAPFGKPNGLLRLASRVASALGRKKLAAELDFAARARGWVGIRPFPGYTGRPHRATAASGAFFAREILGLYEETALRVFRDRDPPPAPAMKWIRLVSLGGRIESAYVPIDEVHVEPAPPRRSSQPSRPHER